MNTALATPTLRRIDLAAVEASLRNLQQHFDQAPRSDTATRDPLDDRVLENMLAGYGLVDALVSERIDVLAPGNAKHLLELNTLVLCGTSPARRDHYRRHIEASEHRFYEQRDGGIRDLVEWSARHKDDGVWERAAGAYVRMLSRPQLFIEGNHRTGALLTSLVLVASGHPPFVLSPGAAAAYFDPALAVSHLDKNSASAYFALSKVKERLAALLIAHSDPRHLLP